MGLRVDGAVAEGRDGLVQVEKGMLRKPNWVAKPVGCSETMMDARKPDQ